MEGWLFWVYGGFWSGKTTFLTIKALEYLDSNYIVFSNIKLNRNFIPNEKNYYFFNDFEEFIDVLKFAWLFAQEVSNYNLKREVAWLPFFPRNDRPKFVVLFDELGIFANSSEFKKLDEKYGGELVQYILQVRKLFTTVYLAVQRPMDIYWKLRQHIHYWYKYKPLTLWDRKINLWKYFWSYWVQELDKDTYQVIIEKDLYYDSDWNLYHVDTPQEQKDFNVWRRPRYYNYYDDLFMNKRLEIKFSTLFLHSSDFLLNLYNSKINNKYLIANKHLYESYFSDIDFNKETFKPLKITFSDHPALYFHQHFIAFKQFMNRKYYFKDIVNFFKKKKASL